MSIHITSTCQHMIDNPFEHIITEARRWVGPDWKFIEIEEISWRAKNAFEDKVFGGLWWPPHGEIITARISLMWPAGVDALWHEVFHSVATNAPLIAHDGSWGEGWCCAFSEVMRQEFNRFPVKEREPQPGNDLERLYNWPCTLLVDGFVNRSAERLRQFWLECNDECWDFCPGEFSHMMRYDPKTGKNL